MRTGILLVDPQNDFFPGGSLGVKNGDKIIQPIMNLLGLFSGAPIFVSQDWHEAGSKHFEERGGKWPQHCIADTPGAAIKQEFLDLFESDAGCDVAGFFLKGTDPEDDAGYSAFEGKNSDGQELRTALTINNIRKLIICGLATDYCVKASALDAIKHNKAAEVYLYTNGIRAVDGASGITAIKEMMSAGVKLL